MPRRPRLFVSRGIYHVYCRIHRGEFRFDDQLESESFIAAVDEVSRTHSLIAPRQDSALQAGNVIALEPKLFFEGVGAVGLENTYLIGEDGVENLTSQVIGSSHRL